MSRPRSAPLREGVRPCPDAGDLCHHSLLHGPHSGTAEADAGYHHCTGRNVEPKVPSSQSTGLLHGPHSDTAEVDAGYVKVRADYRLHTRRYVSTCMLMRTPIHMHAHMPVHISIHMSVCHAHTAKGAGVLTTATPKIETERAAHSARMQDSQGMRAGYTILKKSDPVHGRTAGERRPAAAAAASSASTSDRWAGLLSGMRMRAAAAVWLKLSPERGHRVARGSV